MSDTGLTALSFISHLFNLHGSTAVWIMVCSFMEQKTGSMSLSNFPKVTESESGRPDVSSSKSQGFYFILPTCLKPRRPMCRKQGSRGVSEWGQGQGTR